MSNMTYILFVKGKPLEWLHGEIKTPPLSEAARREMGYLLRMLQEGEKLSLPHSRPMTDIASGCHELRVNDENKTWRLIYKLEAEQIVILEVFEKKTQKTPKEIIDVCQSRLTRRKERREKERKEKGHEKNR